MMMDDDSKRNIKTGAQRAVGFAIVLGVIALGVLACLAWCPKLHYLNAYLPKDDIVVALGPAERKTLNQLISKGVVISASDLYNDTISFYSMLITWLIGILGLTGILGFIYIRGKSQEQAEEQAEKAVEKYFKTVDAHSMVKVQVESEVGTQLDEIRAGLEPLEDLKTAVKRLEEKVEILYEPKSKLPEAAPVPAASNAPAPVGDATKLAVVAEEPPKPAAEQAKGRGPA